MSKKPKQQPKEKAKQKTPGHFQEDVRLIRSIHEDEVLSGNRVSPSAYQPAPEDINSGLSVNCVGLETTNQILSYYRENYM
jgi:hypothetical protein